MKRMFFQSLLLTLIDLAALLIGFAVYKVFNIPNQIVSQAIIAGILVLAGYYFWYRFSANHEWELHTLREVMGTYLSAFVWFFVIFVPLHYLTQGHLTRIENIQAGWFFQAVVNILALFSIWFVSPLFGVKGNEK